MIQRALGTICMPADEALGAGCGTYAIDSQPLVYYNVAVVTLQCCTVSADAALSIRYSLEN